MGSRKRSREEMEAPSQEPAPKPTMLERLRNTWEFANLMQYIFIFGRAVKIDEDLDIDDLEQECLKPEKSQVLSDIGLALLKFISSHRGLTPKIFDEYTRRQYLAKAPQRNPFGEEEEPLKFVDFDVFLKLKVLVQMSQWTLLNPDRMREKMPEVKESDQTLWRIEETGWDRDARSYFVLDDNRLYRMTNPQPAPTFPKTKPKAKSKKGRAAARASLRKRRGETEEEAEDADVETGAENEHEADLEDDGFGGRKWECVAITLEQYQDFLGSIQKSRDADEKALHKRITETVLPEIERQEASHLRKKQRQERELQNLQKLATAKRSSRLEAKFEREKQEQEVAEAERKQREDLAAAKRDQAQQKIMEEARESRMMTREQRLKEREFKRILHEEELANLSEENKRVEAGESQRSERHLKAEMEKKKKDLAALEEEEEWVFDCAKCGIHGTNVDDGSLSIACEKCNVWQHTACLGFTPDEAEKDDFHFICRDCVRREEDRKKPKIPSLKFHISTSSSPPQQKPSLAPPTTNGIKRKSSDGTLPPTKKFKHKEYHPSPSMTGTSIVARPSIPTQNGMAAIVVNGPQLSPQGQGREPLHAGSASLRGGTAFPQAPSYAGHDTSSSWKTESSAKHQIVPGNANGGHGTDSESKKSGAHSKQKPHPSDVPYDPQNHQPYNYRLPPSQTRNPVHQNGHLPQNSHNSYQQQLGGSSSHHGNHVGSQLSRSHGPPDEPAATGWSAQYAPPDATPTQHQSAHKTSPPQQQKHGYPVGSYGSYQHQQSSSSRPVSSHSDQNGQERSSSTQSTQGTHIPSSMTNGFALSPTQNTALDFAPGGPTQSPLVHAYTADPLPPTGPPAHSPVKFASPLTSFNHAPASSPIANQPPLQPSNVPTSPGFSPKKHSPPPQQSTPGHGTTEATPSVLPPVPKLSPSPVQESAAAPLKHNLPRHEHLTSSHKPVQPPILSPSPTPQILAPPTKHATSLTIDPLAQTMRQQMENVIGSDSSQ